MRTPPPTQPLDRELAFALVAVLTVDFDIATCCCTTQRKHERGKEAEDDDAAADRYTQLSKHDRGHADAPQRAIFMRATCAAVRRCGKSARYPFAR